MKNIVFILLLSHFLVGVASQNSDRKIQGELIPTLIGYMHGNQNGTRATLCIMERPLKGFGFKKIKIHDVHTRGCPIKDEKELFFSIDHNEKHTPLKHTHEKFELLRSAFQKYRPPFHGQKRELISNKQ